MPGARPRGPMKTRLRLVRAAVREAVIDLTARRAERDAKTYEEIIGRFIATSQSGVDKLQFAKEFFTAEEHAVFDELLASYRRAASDLSAFLRAKRLRLRSRSAARQEHQGVLRDPTET